MHDMLFDETEVAALEFFAALAKLALEKGWPPHEAGLTPEERAHCEAMVGIWRRLPWKNGEERE